MVFLKLKKFKLSLKCQLKRKLTLLETFYFPFCVSKQHFRNVCFDDNQTQIVVIKNRRIFKEFE